MEGIASTKKAVGDPPEVVSPLKDVAVVVGNDCVFECSINAKPAADIEWFKFNSKLNPGKKYRFDTDGPKQILTIKNAAYEDEGSYYCAARNQFGREEISAKLSVESEPKIDPTFKFRDELQFRQGTSINITLPYVGRPEPKVLWMHEGRRFNYKNQSIETTDKYTYLVIPEAHRSTHCSKYTVELANAHGSNKYSVNVDIHCKPDTPKNLEFVSSNYTSIKLAWEAPKDTV